jgi:dipeptidyl aminopeptidase/acylaminoacyl peptidase
VVPPEQSKRIVERLQANRVPHVYRLYEGEGHGFSKAETLVDYYQTVERFLREQVIFRRVRGDLNALEGVRGSMLEL